MRPVRIGIDVGSRAVKVAWITSSRNGKPEWHWAQRPRNPADSPDQLPLTLRELLRPLTSRRYDAPVLVAVTQSHVRQLTLEVADVKQIPQAIHEQLPRLFPFDAARCHSRYRLMSQGSANGKLACRLQVAACDLEGLRHDLEAFWRIGWIPSEAVPASAAIMALAKAQGELSADAVLFLELGARRSILALAAQEQIVFAREVGLGSDYLTEALMSQVVVGQESLQLSWEEAESLKCQVGIPEDGSHEQPLEGLPAPPTGGAQAGRLPLATYQALAQPVWEQWLSEIQRTIAFSIQANPEAVPQRLLLCGGGSQLRGLDRWLSKQLGMPVERMTLQPILQEELPAFSVACGLLLADGKSSLNLLPEKTLQARRLIRWQRAAIKGLILAGLVVWLGVGGLHFQRARIQQRLASVEQRWQDLKPVTSLAETVESHANLLHTLAETQGIAVGWFGQLATGFPNPVRLTELSVGAGREVRMVGQAQGREQTPEAYVSELAMWLERMRLCQGVRLGSSQRSPRDPELVDFSLTCQRW